MATDFFNFNDAGEQKSFDVIPDNTIATCSSPFVRVAPAKVGG